MACGAQMVPSPRPSSLLLPWMWGALLAATMAAWLHQLTTVTAGEDIIYGHGVRGGKAMIATLRWRLIAVPGRLIRHAATWCCGSRPAAACFPRSWPGSGTCPSPPDLRTLSPGSPSLSTANQPRPAERPQIANPAPAPGLSACPLPGILGHHDHLPGQGSAHRAIRGIGSDCVWTAHLSGHQVVINGNALHPPQSSNSSRRVAWRSRVPGGLR